MSTGTGQKKVSDSPSKICTSKYTHTHALVFPAKRKCIGHHYFIPKRLCFHLDSASSLYFSFFLSNTHMQNHRLKAFHPVLSHLLLFSYFFMPHQNLPRSPLFVRFVSTFTFFHLRFLSLCYFTVGASPLFSGIYFFFFFLDR